ncbi:MAG: RagB/SusD family nutrient uptake outer membrane protein [Prevotella sp.]|nr:RagB/SusD family nutrient uptake outer membrane protein [Prevotella sp.]MCI1685578.1 RagB/SusD family nutrient uptake outer membrane protein [Prevotella sp.]MCI1802450.1 RagB/SusD family nutrient uptake outer membrane protein [Prevotella sp.]MCI1816775.1 RagB/SusD family nutrient uptake outer membrane protein [Prevotella sp.]MCI2137273.1 RagB/SusD family nutrient uptake outer membrane protein [Prevotella sp.]MCI2150083.1 RagB/SusD family nutrient uptake outer membrane protein [Prevotella sp
MKKINIIGVMFLSLVCTSCGDLFVPEKENNLGVDYMDKNASYAEGVLGNAYTRIPCGSFSFDDVATDDAISNDPTDNYRKMAAGTWTSDNNPEEKWRNCRAAIKYINLFLSRAENVQWATDTIASHMYKDREMGEAYGLRAMYMFYLLQAHAGYSLDGTLLGIPIVTGPETTNGNFNIPRNTFKECIQAINNDCSKALSLLPTKYIDGGEIPAKYQKIGATQNEYDRVFGAKFNGRMDGAIVEAFRSKAALLAASPAFNANSGVTWAEAANSAAIVLDRIGGVGGMDPKGWTWYANTTEIDGLKNGSCPAEVMWRGEKSQDNTWEAKNFPPSLYGRGRINPTQNFVDAFPMANGYPITDSESGYNASDPYSNRDPRLAAYVVLNGSTEGVDNTVITTASDGSTKDALNKVNGSSTRTGYYLRKLLRQDVNLNPTSVTKQYHYTPRIRYTEIFLDYAEAANEAWGPTGTGGHAYSAYDVIKAIRSRAGVGKDNGDAYLESIKNDKDKMRQLIRNERRIELSFEGFRFWDLRRWKSNLNETTTGMDINSANNTYKKIDVDTRNYKDYQYYGPIPYSEVLKFNQLIQNKGW